VSPKIAFVVMCFLFSYATCVKAQSAVPDFKGFSQSNVPLIEWHPEPLMETRSVHGAIRDAGGPIQGAIFEIRRMDASGRIRSARTNNRGEFHIARIPDGKYIFKTTVDDHKSYAGILVVGKKQVDDVPLEIELTIGY
jgi:Prealbumin-like fold domain